MNTPSVKMDDSLSYDVLAHLALVCDIAATGKMIDDAAYAAYLSGLSEPAEQAGLATLIGELIAIVSVLCATGVLDKSVIDAAAKRRLQEMVAGQETAV